MQITPRERLLRSGDLLQATLFGALESALVRYAKARTNIIESSFATVERICSRVKRWQRGDERLRWVASALLYSESRWNRLQGHRQIPRSRQRLETAYALRLREKRALAQTSAA